MSFFEHKVDELSEIDLKEINYNTGFDKGAHQVMQETRLEIALNLIKQVAAEEMSEYLVDAQKGVEKALNKFRQSGR